MVENVTYNPVNWEDKPSENTPVNAANLGNMDGGISNCVERANASVPAENILTLDECDAATEAGKYIPDALAVKQLSSDLGGNSLSYVESEDAYYIQHGADAVPKKLGKPTLLETVTFNGGRSSRVIDISTRAGHEHMSEDNFIVAITSMSVVVKLFCNSNG